jgi:molybdenum cofactor cytidylyltransferase
MELIQLQDNARMAALILAAGASPRIGQPKSLLPFARSTVLESLIDKFRGAGIKEIVVVTGDNATQLESVLRGAPVRCVFNPHYREGMYKSYAVGIRAMPPEVDACFLQPVDMPLLQVPTIEKMKTAYQGRHAPITYPVSAGRRGHPVLVAATLFAAISEYAGEGGMRGFLARYQKSAAEVDVIDEGIHLDIDSLNDYATIRVKAARLPHTCQLEG